MSQNTKNKAFTLIELLVGIVVIGIISLVAMRIIFNMVNYRAKQFAIEDTSDSFRDFISNFTTNVRNASAVTIDGSGSIIEIVGDNCVSYRLNSSVQTIEKSQASASPCNGSYNRILQDNIKINAFSLSPVGVGVSVVNIDIQGSYVDSTEERPFTYTTSVAKRL